MKPYISILQVQTTLNIRKDFICPHTYSKLYPTEIKPLLRFKLFVFTYLDIFCIHFLITKLITLLQSIEKF